MMERTKKKAYITETSRESRDWKKMNVAQSAMKKAKKKRHEIKIDKLLVINIQQISSKK